MGKNCTDHSETRPAGQDHNVSVTDPEITEWLGYGTKLRPPVRPRGNLFALRIGELIIRRNATKRPIGRISV